MGHARSPRPNMEARITSRKRIQLLLASKFIGRTRLRLLNANRGMRHGRGGLAMPPVLAFARRQAGQATLKAGMRGRPGFQAAPLRRAARSSAPNAGYLPTVS